VSSDESLTERHPISAASQIQRLRITVAEGTDAGFTTELDPSSAIPIGTAQDNAIVLRDPTVSRYHLELHRAEGGVRVVDLGSLNGSLVSGLRIERAIVPVPARIAIGRTILAIDDGAVEARSLPEPRVELPGIVGISEAIQSVSTQIARVARSQATVILLGETGTGKEVFARAIHEMSPRKDGPFVVVDCGSLAPTLIASELFGHEKGAFTGADERRAGAFERANGGTIVIDEIGELPLAVQPALLGVLERRRIKRLGSDREQAIDVRVVSSTHRDLRAEVNRGNFRADLYFRLAVARIVIPPLRDHPEDIPVLIEHFVREATGGAGESPFGPASIEALSSHPWSGNVRELRNVVESALATGQVSLEGARGEQQQISGDTAIVPYKEARAKAVGDFERIYLSRLIESCEGNVSAAARRARMDRPYLLSLLRRHNLR
jgi:DNA-binding NtrC family response regulator